MAFLSQAPRLEGLLPSHGAFQGHAAHLMRWSMRLSPNGSRGTCIPPGLTTFLHAAFTAHQWRARASADALSLAQNPTFRRAQSSVHDTPRAHLRARFPPRPARDSRTPTRYDSPAAVLALFFSALMSV